MSPVYRADSVTGTNLILSSVHRFRPKNRAEVFIWEILTVGAEISVGITLHVKVGVTLSIPKANF